LRAEKIKGSPREPHNQGYDDERGEYKVALHDHLAYRYEVLEVLGSGSFGQALKCFDYKRNEEVALKIIRNKKRFHHQAAIEAKVLKYIKDHDPDQAAHLVTMKEFFVFRSHFVRSTTITCVVYIV
jgi:dual specificity tyrosine-phosphorylation-regulated kinase 2/3/4